MTDTRIDKPLPPLPHSDEAEQGLLGSILLENGVLSTVIDRIEAFDFFQMFNRKIFGAMVKLHKADKVIDYISLSEGLGHDLEAAGGIAYLTSLPNGLQGPRAKAVLHYVEIIKKHATRRNLIHSVEAERDAAFAGEDPATIIERLRKRCTEIESAGDTSAVMFDSPGDFMNTPELRFAIQNFLQIDATTIVGGLSGHGKTWVMLSIAKALLDKPALLWNHFPVNERTDKVIYLIPESTRSPFKHRLTRLGLMKYIGEERLLVRTLSKGPRIELDDPRLLAAANGAHVFLDTIGRWSEGDENSANDNQRGLASDCFGLLGAGARSVVAAHHSPKGFSKEIAMSLENCLRGSGDVGAMVGTAFGIRQIDAAQNIVHIECVKPRDFEPPAPFQLIGRPYIDDEGDFRMYRKPGECGPLEDYLQAKNKGGGAPQVIQEARNANLALLRTMLRDNPNLTSKELSQRFAAIDIKLGDSAIRKYRKDLGL